MKSLEREGKSLVLYYIVSKTEKAPFSVSSKISFRFVKAVHHMYISIKPSSSGFWCSVLFAVGPEYNLLEKYSKAPVLCFSISDVIFQKLLFLAYTLSFSYFYLSLHSSIS